MKGILRLTLLSSIAAMTVGSAMAAENSFKAVVKDKNGKPVQGVTLSVLSGGKKFGAGTTDANGEVNVPLDLGNVSTGQSMQAVVRKCHAEDGTETAEMILAAANAQIPPKEKCDDHVAGFFPWPQGSGFSIAANLDNLTLSQEGVSTSSAAPAPNTPQTGAVSGGTGQGFVCTVKADVQPTLRKEELTEFTGDIVLRCNSATTELSPKPGEGQPALNIKLSVDPIEPNRAGGGGTSLAIRPGPVAVTTLPDGHLSTTTGVVSGPTVTFEGIPNTPYDIKITHIEISEVTPRTEQPPSGIELKFSEVTVEYPVQFKPPAVSIHLDAVDEKSAPPATAGAPSPATLREMANNLEPGDPSIFAGGNTTRQDQPGGGYSVTRTSADGNVRETTTFGPGNQIISKSTTVVPPLNAGAPATSTTTTVLTNGSRYVEEGGGQYFTVTAYDSSGTAFAHLEITVHGSFVEVSTSSNAKPEPVTTFTPWDGKSTLELGNIINKIKSDFIASTQTSVPAPGGGTPAASGNPPSASTPAEKPLFWWQVGGGLGAKSFSSVNGCGPLLSVVPDATCHAGDRAFGGEVEGQIGVTPYFAGGFSYNNFKGIQRTASAPSIGEHSSFHTQFETITGRAILPFGPIPLLLFGEGGVALAQNHLKETQTAGSGSSPGSSTTSFRVNTTSPTVGGGLQINLSKHIAIGARVQYFHAEKGPVLNEHNLVTVGTVTFRDFFR